MQPAKRNPGLLVTDTVKIVASAAAGLVSGLYSVLAALKSAPTNCGGQPVNNQSM
jgi:hypothetical protein